MPVRQWQTILRPYCNRDDDSDNRIRSKRAEIKEWVWLITPLSHFLPPSAWSPPCFPSKAMVTAATSWVPSQSWIMHHRDCCLWCTRQWISCGGILLLFIAAVYKICDFYWDKSLQFFLIWVTLLKLRKCAPLSNFSVLSFVHMWGALQCPGFCSSAHPVSHYYPSWSFLSVVACIWNHWNQTKSFSDISSCQRFTCASAALITFCFLCSILLPDSSHVISSTQNHSWVALGHRWTSFVRENSPDQEMGLIFQKGKCGGVEGGTIRSLRIYQRKQEEDQRNGSPFLN